MFVAKVSCAQNWILEVQSVTGTKGQAPMIALWNRFSGLDSSRYGEVYAVDTTRVVVCAIVLTSR